MQQTEPKKTENQTVRPTVTLERYPSNAWELVFFLIQIAALLCAFWYAFYDIMEGRGVTFLFISIGIISAASTIALAIWKREQWRKDGLDSLGIRVHKRNAELWAACTVIGVMITLFTNGYVYDRNNWNTRSSNFSRAEKLLQKEQNQSQCERANKPECDYLWDQIELAHKHIYIRDNGLLNTNLRNIRYSLTSIKAADSKVYSAMNGDTAIRFLERADYGTDTDIIYEALLKAMPLLVLLVSIFSTSRKVALAQYEVDKEREPKPKHWREYDGV